MEHFSDFKIEDALLPSYCLTWSRSFFANDLAQKEENALLMEPVKQILEDCLEKQTEDKKETHYFRTFTDASLVKHDVVITSFKQGLSALVLGGDLFPANELSGNIRDSLSNIFATLPLLSRHTEIESIKYIDEIQTNCYSILRSATNIETIGHVEREDMQSTSIDMASLIKSIVESIKTIGIKQNIIIKEDIPSFPVCVKGNKKLFSDVLLNIIRNCLQFSRDGNIVDIKLLVKNQRAVLTIKDRGIGIKEEYIAEVFSPHFSVNPYGDTSEKPGLGLGLSNAQSIVKSFGGVMAIESRFGEGTSISISLPMDESTGNVLGSSSGEYLLNRYSPIYIHLADFCHLPTIY